MLDGLKILELDVDGIGMVKILSFKELPDDRVTWMRQANSPESLVDKLFFVVELCLIDPRLIEAFKDLEPLDFFKFYRQWGVASGWGSAKK